MGKLKIGSSKNIGNIKKAIDLISKGDKRKYWILTSLQAALSVVDLASIAVVGLIGSIAVNGISQVGPGEATQKWLAMFGLENFSIQSQAAILGLVVGLLLTSKSIGSMMLNRKMLFFLGYRSAKISRQLISKLVQQNALVLESNSAQKLIYSATTGINSIVIGVLGNFSALIGDVSLCIVLGVGLFIYSPGTTIVTLFILGLILLGLFFYINKQSVRLSTTQTRIGIVNAELLSELLENYRETIVRSRRGYYEKSIAQARDELASVSAKQTWLPNISKYILEITVTVFTLLLAYLQFSAKDAAQAVGSLAIFLVAGARLAPSLLRIQQFVIAMNAHAASAEPTYDLFNRMRGTEVQVPIISKYQRDHLGFEPEIRINNLMFSYPGSENLTIKIPDLKIKKGEFIAVVGPSGAGKSTLIDLILGILEPQQGEVLISGKPPVTTFNEWPGAVAYVSQKVSFPTGTVKSCISGGYDQNDISDEYIWDSLKKAFLDDYVKKLPSQLNEFLGERAIKLSGGQRQRLAIGRALLTEPNLLVMDEATSSLDSETEAKVSESIQELHGQVTLLVVAHRLSTVRMADRVIYMDGGKIIAEGNFEKVRQSVPNFDKQARLMGL
jgi:ABC-type multidrug transport system fused ATPase/permease subunit